MSKREVGNSTASNNTSMNFTRTSISNSTAGIGASTTDPSILAAGQRRIRIALGVGISVGSISICLGLALALKRYRRNKRSKIVSRSEEDSSSPKNEDQAPYLQPEGELDAHGNNKFELGGSTNWKGIRRFMRCQRMQV